jgi:hypothetical protein
VLLKLLRIGLGRLNDKIRLPRIKKVNIMVGDSLMQFFSEVFVVVLGDAYLR